MPAAPSPVPDSGATASRDRTGATDRVGQLLRGRGELVTVLVVSLLGTAAAMWWSFRIKAACGGPTFDEFGRSARFPGGEPGSILPCYSDLMFLWVGRDIDRHVFPYLSGGITADGTLYGGVVEYPVLSGVLMYLGAIGADTDLEFLARSALLLAPFGFAITIMLAILTRWWVLLWAITPPLVLYSFHNWELPVVATTVAAVTVMALGATISPRTGRPRLSLRTAAVIAAILLSIGFALKLYPAFFVLPLLLYVLTGGARGSHRDDRPALDWAGAIWVAVAAFATVIVIHAPFWILGFEGWRASLAFQSNRGADMDTNTFWYWGFRLLVNDPQTYKTLVSMLSLLLIAVAFAVAVYLGVRAYRTTGVFPWIGVSASMLAGFMLFHKVHSPQYTLWLLPFFIMLRIWWPIIVAYLVTDVILDISIFPLLGLTTVGPEWWPKVGVVTSVWVHMALLAVLIFSFVRAPLRQPLARFVSAPATLPESRPDRAAV